MNALYTAMFTLIGGVLIFAISQFILKRIIEPYIEFMRLKGRIVFALTMYADQMHNPNSLKLYFKDERIRERADTTGIELRGIAAKLLESYYLIPFKFVFVCFKRIPKIEQIEKLSGSFIGLSNSLVSDSEGSVDENLKRINEVREILGLEFDKKKSSPPGE